MKIIIGAFIAFICISSLQAAIPQRYARPVLWKDMDMNSGDIIGGEIATHGQFPYQAAVTIDSSSFCGGSIISQKVIMTAAHCAFLKTSFEIWLGTQDRSVNEPERVIITTTDKIVHELYATNLDTNGYDIALLISPTDVTYTAFIQPIRLPPISEATNTYIGILGTVSGWGKISETVGGAVDELRYVSIPVIDSQACLDHYGFAVPSQLCLSVDGGKGSCSGDSGGPYVYNETDGVLTQIGMVSYGSNLGCVSGPKGFMKVSFFSEWIQTNTGIIIRP